MDFRILSDPRDLTRLKDALLRGAGVLTALLDAAGPLRRALVRRLITRGETIAGLRVADASVMPTLPRQPAHDHDRRARG
ncbi:hypothetical protein [Paenirhodobacter sp.]|uniref:hypothetical protein n=1 Tax=Paenirhodobacter sp. TaxID=1965326 RepID=UPI003B3E61F8